MENVFIVNNVNILSRVEESKSMYFDYDGIKLFNKFLFLEFLKILIRQNSVYWMITGEIVSADAMRIIIR